MSIEDVKPVLICGAPGSGTSLVAKILRHAGVFVGADAGAIDARKFHESRCFREANKRILEATIDFPYAPKSVTQFQTHVALLNDRIDSVVQRIDVESLLDQFFQAHRRDVIWGWKDPRNSANVLVWRRLFPQLRILTIEKRWSRFERNRPGSEAGNWFRQASTARLRKLYVQPPHREGLESFPLSFDKMLKCRGELRQLWDWLGLEPDSFPGCRFLLEQAGVGLDMD